jgi:hypothetical protein
VGIDVNTDIDVKSRWYNDPQLSPIKSAQYDNNINHSIAKALNGGKLTVAIEILII